MDLAAIDLLILDVDGVLTDGRVTFGPDGPVERTFSVQDGCALKLWHEQGQRSALVSGRSSPVLEQRGRELGVTTVVQGADDKRAACERLLADWGADFARVCYVGDDLPDLGPMARAGLPVAVGNAVPAVKQAAEYVTRHRGGDGAVAEVVERLLRKQRRWPSVALERVGVSRR